MAPSLAFWGLTFFLVVTITTAQERYQLPEQEHLLNEPPEEFSDLSQGYSAVDSEHIPSLATLEKHPVIKTAISEIIDHFNNDIKTGTNFLYKFYYVFESVELKKTGLVDLANLVFKETNCVRGGSVVDLSRCEFREDGKKQTCHVNFRYDVNRELEKIVFVCQPFNSLYDITHLMFYQDYKENVCKLSRIINKERKGYELNMNIELKETVCPKTTKFPLNLHSCPFLESGKIKSCQIRILHDAKTYPKELYFQCKCDQCDKRIDHGVIIYTQEKYENTVHYSELDRAIYILRRDYFQSTNQTTFEYYNSTIYEKTPNSKVITLHYKEGECKHLDPLPSKLTDCSFVKNGKEKLCTFTCDADVKVGVTKATTSYVCSDYVSDPPITPPRVLIKQGVEIVTRQINEQLQQKIPYQVETVDVTQQTVDQLQCRIILNQHSAKTDVAPIGCNIALHLRSKVCPGQLSYDCTYLAPKVWITDAVVQGKIQETVTKLLGQYKKMNVIYEIQGANAPFKQGVSEGQEIQIARKRCLEERTTPCPPDKLSVCQVLLKTNELTQPDSVSVSCPSAEFDAELVRLVELAQKEAVKDTNNKFSKKILHTFFNYEIIKIQPEAKGKTIYIRVGLIQTNCEKDKPANYRYELEDLKGCAVVQNKEQQICFVGILINNAVNSAISSKIKFYCRDENEVPPGENFDLVLNAVDAVVIYIKRSDYQVPPATAEFSVKELFSKYFQKIANTGEWPYPCKDPGPTLSNPSSEKECKLVKPEGTTTISEWFVFSCKNKVKSDGGNTDKGKLIDKFLPCEAVYTINLRLKDEFYIRIKEVITTKEVEGGKIFKIVIVQTTCKKAEVPPNMVSRCPDKENGEPKFCTVFVGNNSTSLRPNVDFNCDGIPDPPPTEIIPPRPTVTPVPPTIENPVPPATVPPFTINFPDWVTTDPPFTFTFPKRNSTVFPEITFTFPGTVSTVPPVTVTSPMTDPPPPVPRPTNNYPDPAPPVPRPTSNTEIPVPPLIERLILKYLLQYCKDLKLKYAIVIELLTIREIIGIKTVCDVVIVPSNCLTIDVNINNIKQCKGIIGPNRQTCLVEIIDDVIVKFVCAIIPPPDQPSYTTVIIPPIPSSRPPPVVPTPPPVVPTPPPVVPPLPPVVSPLPPVFPTPPPVVPTLPPAVIPDSVIVEIIILFNRKLNSRYAFIIEKFSYKIIGGIVVFDVLLVQSDCLTAAITAENLKLCKAKDSAEKQQCQIVMNLSNKRTKAVCNSVVPDPTPLQIIETVIVDIMFEINFKQGPLYAFIFEKIANYTVIGNTIVYEIIIVQSGCPINQLTKENLKQCKPKDSPERQKCTCTVKVDSSSVTTNVTSCVPVVPNPFPPDIKDTPWYKLVLHVIISYCQEQNTKFVYVITKTVNVEITRTKAIYDVILTPSDCPTAGVTVENINICKPTDSTNKQNCQVEYDKTTDKIRLICTAVVTPVPPPFEIEIVSPEREEILKRILYYLKLQLRNEFFYKVTVVVTTKRLETVGNIRDIIQFIIKQTSCTRENVPYPTDVAKCHIIPTGPEQECKLEVNYVKGSKPYDTILPTTCTLIEKIYKLPPDDEKIKYFITHLLNKVNGGGDVFYFRLVQFISGEVKVAETDSYKIVFVIGETTCPKQAGISLESVCPVNQNGETRTCTAVITVKPNEKPVGTIECKRNEPNHGGLTNNEAQLYANASITILITKHLISSDYRILRILNAERKDQNIFLEVQLKKVSCQCVTTCRLTITHVVTEQPVLTSTTCNGKRVL